MGKGEKRIISIPNSITNMKRYKVFRANLSAKWPFMLLIFFIKSSHVNYVGMLIITAVIHSFIHSFNWAKCPSCTFNQVFITIFSNSDSNFTTFTQKELAVKLIIQSYSGARKKNTLKE